MWGAGGRGSACGSVGGGRTGGSAVGRGSGTGGAVSGGSSAGSGGVGVQPAVVMSPMEEAALGVPTAKEEEVAVISAVEKGRDRGCPTVVSM